MEELWCAHSAAPATHRAAPTLTLGLRGSATALAKITAILTALGLLSILGFTVRRSRPTAAFALLFFFTTQLHNVVYHVGAGVYFADYSPGTVTAVALYLPINLWLLWQAR